MFLAFLGLSFLPKFSFYHGNAKTEKFLTTTFLILLLLFLLSNSLLFWKRNHFCSSSLISQTANKILFVSKNLVGQPSENALNMLRSVSCVFDRFSLFMRIFYPRTQIDEFLTLPLSKFFLPALRTGILKFHQFLSKSSGQVRTFEFRGA